jgi:hypothetical protein
VKEPFVPTRSSRGAHRRRRAHRHVVDHAQPLSTSPTSAPTCPRSRADSALRTRHLSPDQGHRTSVRTDEARTHIETGTGAHCRGGRRHPERERRNADAALSRSRHFGPSLAPGDGTPRPAGGYPMSPHQRRVSTSADDAETHALTGAGRRGSAGERFRGRCCQHHHHPLSHWAATLARSPDQHTGGRRVRWQPGQHAVFTREQRGRADRHPHPAFGGPGHRVGPSTTGTPVPGWTVNKHTTPPWGGSRGTGATSKWDTGCQKMPAGPMSSMSARPISQARRRVGRVANAAAGSGVSPIGLSAFQSISITRRSRRT